MSDPYATIDNAIAELERLRARVAKLEAALESIANTYDESWRTGCQERRIGDEARAALSQTPDLKR